MGSFVVITVVKVISNSKVRLEFHLLTAVSIYLLTSLYTATVRHSLTT